MEWVGRKLGDPAHFSFIMLVKDTAMDHVLEVSRLQKNIGDISRQLFVVELPNDLVDFSSGAFQMVRGRNWSALHDAEAFLF